MKAAILFALIAVCAAADYSRYEDFDVDELISNKRLLTSYCACFLGPGKCTPEGNDFKKWIPDAVQTQCKDCSEHQKHMVAKVIKAIQEQLPQEWEKLIDKYDAEKKLRNNLNPFIEKYGH